MQDTNKALMALVRSLRRSLKHDHGIEVPHAALRASLLQAQGESPHAFGDKVDRLQSLVEEAPRYFHPGYDFDGQKLDWLRRAGAVPSNARLQPDDRSACRLHLVSDGHGILSLLSLDAEGCFVCHPRRRAA